MIAEIKRINELPTIVIDGKPIAEMAEELDPLDEVKQLIASGVDKKTALAQVAKKRRIPKRELYNQLISEGEGISE
jgi:16S rRNA C1402 (ribose-2'-O) methylase RsmI